MGGNPNFVAPTAPAGDSSQRVANTQFVTNQIGSSAGTAMIEIILDGAGAPLTTGIKGFAEINFTCTIVRSSLLSSTTANLVVNVWKTAIANFPPTVASKITASAPPTITTALYTTDTTLSGWTVGINAGDCLAFNIDSIQTASLATLSLTVKRQ